MLKHTLHAVYNKPTLNKNSQVTNKKWRGIYYVITNLKKTGIATLISVKVDFKTREPIRDKNRHYIRKQIFPEDMKILNVYSPNNRL